LITTQFSIKALFSGMFLAWLMQAYNNGKWYYYNVEMGRWMLLFCFERGGQMEVVKIYRK
jgi:hypothetical protein